MRVNETSYQQRYHGFGQLYGATAQRQLSQAHFVVVGLGGVGSWSAEALARSGIGHITLIDLDDICISNTNRQLHTTADSVGLPKCEAMRARLQQIDPALQITATHDFLTKKNMTQLITPEHDMVIEATDNATIKSAAVAYCLARKIGLITVGSAGGKTDPNQVQHADLGKTTHDPMLAKVRQQLFKTYRFARDSDRKFRVDAIFSTEHRRFANLDGEICLQKSALFGEEGGSKLDCANSLGSSVMVTGTFGFLAAARAIERYLQKTKR